MLIAFEGPDGTGKTTICKNLHKILGSKRTCKIINSPQHTVFGQAILELSTRHKLRNISLMLLYTAYMIELRQHIENAIKEYEVVLLDRYYLSNYMYNVFCVNEHDIAIPLEVQQEIAGLKKYARDNNTLMMNLITMAYGKNEIGSETISLMKTLIDVTLPIYEKRRHATMFHKQTIGELKYSMLSILMKHIEVIHPDIWFIFTDSLTKQSPDSLSSELLDVEYNYYNFSHKCVTGKVSIYNNAAKIEKLHGNLDMFLKKYGILHDIS